VVMLFPGVPTVTAVSAPEPSQAGNKRDQIKTRQRENRPNPKHEFALCPERPWLLSVRPKTDGQPTLFWEEKDV
jgi:hypothetical protein